MSHRATARKIVEELKRGTAPEPPEGLRESLLREVPETLELAPELTGGREAPVRRPARWALAAAASVVLAVGAGVVAVRVMDEMDEPAARRVRGDALAAPEPPTGAESSAPRAEEKDEELQALGYVAPPRPAEPRQRTEAAREARRAVPDPRPSEPASRPSDERRGGRSETLPKAEPEAPALKEVVTVTSESPLLDGRRVTSGTSASQAKPEPPARAAERSYSVDGVVVTDMEEAGSSPTYYDLDHLQEMNVSEAALARAERMPIPEPPMRVGGAPGTLPPSTGGTAEPNDQPYGDVFFRTYGTNPFLDTEDDPLSTFALDVDTGSYGVVRRYLTDGHLPPPEAVRVEELVNAFDYGDPPPAPGDEGADFALRAEGSRSPFMAGERYHLLRFGIRARDVAAADRKPAVLTFVVDVSGSMAAENRLGLVKQALGLLLDELRDDDRVGLVVYGSRGRVVLEPTGDLAAIRRAIGHLAPEGATNAEEGLTLGYDMARRAFREGEINRVILCSDGVANVGATGPDSILERIGEEARGGVELTTVGFGMGNYNDVLMEQLADRGDGAYAYVDTLDEARRVFVENLTGTLQTIARDAKVQVELDPRVVARYRLLGYENRDVPDERFRDDTVDAGEVGAGHTVTALYELKLHPGASDRATAATLRLRYRSAETGRVEEVSRDVTVRELRRSWERAPRDLRLASVVAELAEILKGSYWAKDADLDDLFRRAQAVSADYPGDLRVAELAALVGKAAALAGER